MNNRTMELQAILKELDLESVDGDIDRRVASVAYDSRAVQPGSLFVAVQGTETDGNRFAVDAIRNGAIAVLSAQERAPGSAAATWIRVGDDRTAMARAAAAFYEHPDREMSVVGITGTNGKTTTAFLLHSILSAAGRPAGLLGTVWFEWPGHRQPAVHTTPESVDVFHCLREMVGAGCNDAVLEVSSHALALRRVEGLRFEAGIFTNLSQDHLDFHQSLEDYFDAKAVLFESLEAGATAVLNVDDPRGEALRRRTAAQVRTYGMADRADVWVQDATFTASGTQVRLATPGGAVNLQCHLPGRRNLENLLAAVAGALALSVDADAIAAGVSALRGVPGRFERVACGQPFEVIVDFAHTDDALRKLLAAVRELGPARVITVFGCGGDRDRTKRPLMGEAAATGSDVVILSSDNPRGEDPEVIADGAQEGIDAACRAAERPIECHRILDRRQAIRLAIDLAREGDAVVIAGKGHERTQLVGEHSLPFDDREECRAALERRFSGGRRG